MSTLQNKASNSLLYGKETHKAIDGMTVNHEYLNGKLWRNSILVTSLVDKIYIDPSKLTNEHRSNKTSDE
jgi:hypothetical protein